MIHNLITILYFFIIIGVTPLSYQALSALDFSKLFKSNSTWQIKILLMFISFIISFLIATAFRDIVVYLIKIVNPSL